MIKIKQAVIVEGKYDKIKLSSILDAVIIETDGFGIFKNKEKQLLIKKMADKCGILILTDSDAAGFQIRSFIGGTVPKEKIIHAYIPDIFGKEKRKETASKEGKLGVEGVSNQIILDVLEKAGVTCEHTETQSRRIAKIDFYEDGLMGSKDSKEKREKLLKYFELPERLSTNALFQIINIIADYDEYKKAVSDIENGNIS